MIKILLAGEGGQGIQTIAKALANAAVEAGKECTYIPAFGVEQRGTPSIAFITVSADEIRYPRFDAADFVIILQKRAISAVVDYISPNTKVIFDSSTIAASDLPKKAIKIYGIPATKYAYEKFTPRAFNVLVLGKLTKILDVSSEAAWKVIMKLLGKKFKTPEIEAKNREAFQFGREVVFEEKDFTVPIFVPKVGKNIFKGHGKVAEIVPERCKGCGICVFKCPVAALKMGSELGVYASPIPEIDLEKCIACGNCRKFCPDGAIGVEKI
ncbi:MAG: 2-oxoacid:acceptor oxidoreductase family protein [bacterium]